VKSRAIPELREAGAEYRGAGWTYQTFSPT